MSLHNKRQQKVKFRYHKNYHLTSTKFRFGSWLPIRRSVSRHIQRQRKRLLYGFTLAMLATWQQHCALKDVANRPVLSKCVTTWNPLLKPSSYSNIRYMSHHHTRRTVTAQLPIEGYTLPSKIHNMVWMLFPNVCKAYPTYEIGRIEIAIKTH